MWSGDRPQVPPPFVPIKGRWLRPLPSSFRACAVFRRFFSSTTHHSFPSLCVPQSLLKRAPCSWVLRRTIGKTPPLGIYGPQILLEIPPQNKQKPAYLL